jgi:hypothetical protein
LSSRSPPPDFPSFRHRAVSSSFSVEPPVPFPFPLAPPSHCITIMSRSAACTYLAAIVGAARVSPLFFSHILFKSILFLSSNLFSQTLFFLRWLPLSFSPLCCLLPARDVVRSLCARVGQRTTRHCPRCGPLLLAMPLHACCPCTPSRRVARCYAGPSPSRPLALAVCALSPSIPAAINGEVPVLPVTLPCRPSPLFLSAYKSDPKPPLTPPTPPQHLPSSTLRCSSPPPLTIASHHPSPWTALRRPPPHEVMVGIGPPRPPLRFPLLPGRCHAPGD